MVLTESINFDKEREIKVLDLGSGTGHGMKLVANEFPQATITGVDFSTKMISKAKNHLQGFEDRVKLIEADFNDYQFKNNYDRVISAVAIHNSTHEQKRALFNRIYVSLKPGGQFINADFYQHDQQQVNQQLQQIYRQFLENNLEGKELQVWLRHAFEEDKPMSLTKQASFLRKAGFEQFKLLWLFNNQAVYSVTK